MIERVARVLCRFTWEAQFGKQDLDACVDQEWPNHTDAARLSIAAMRSPTEAMIQAARRSAPYDRDDVEEMWSIMIAAALK